MVRLRGRLPGQGSRPRVVGRSGGVQNRVEFAPDAVAARDDGGASRVGVAAEDRVGDPGEVDRPDLDRVVGAVTDRSERVLAAQTLDHLVVVPSRVVERDPQRSRALDVEADLVAHAVADRDADTGHRLEQAVLADVDGDVVAAAGGAHDRDAAADVGARADRRTDRHTAFDHVRTREVRAEVGEARGHHDRAGPQVGAQASRASQADRVVQVDVVDEQRELVQQLDREELALALHRPTERRHGLLAAVEDALVRRPERALQLGEDLLEVDLVQRDVPARHECQAQARLGHAEGRHRHEVADRHEDGLVDALVAEARVLNHVEHVLHGLDVAVRELVVRLFLGPGELGERVLLEAGQVDVAEGVVVGRAGDGPQQREAAVVVLDVAVRRREEDVGDDVVLLGDVTERPRVGLVGGELGETLSPRHLIGELRRRRRHRGIGHRNTPSAERMGGESNPLMEAETPVGTCPRSS